MATKISQVIADIDEELLDIDKGERALRQALQALLRAKDTLRYTRNVLTSHLRVSAKPKTLSPTSVTASRTENDPDEILG